MRCNGKPKILRRHETPQIVNKVNKMIGFNKRSSSRHAETEHRSLLELQVSSGGFSSNEEIGRLLTASQGLSPCLILGISSIYALIY